MRVYNHHRLRGTCGHRVHGVEVRWPAPSVIFFFPVIRRGLANTHSVTLITEIER
jgi:hypothetical protein